jgi:hypothetical protein
MPGDHLRAEARRVVSGVDAQGLSTVVSDRNTTSRLAGAGSTKCDIWRVDDLPAQFDDWGSLTDDVVTMPAPRGFVYRLTTFPPDSEWDASAGYADSRGPIPDREPAQITVAVPGMHVTETIDIVTVLSGEIYAVLETCETLLRPGDTFVQRGTRHAWHNRSDQPVTVVSLMVGASTHPSAEPA